MQPRPHERLGERDLETWDGPDLGSSSREEFEDQREYSGLDPAILNTDFARG